jgi:predicted GNAT family N-acyltransferase
VEVRTISAEDTYQIRNIMLRAGKPVQTCHFPGDHDELTFHLGAIVNKKLASVASFYFEAHPKFIENHPNQYRLRGMATLVEYQAQGLSSQLLKTAFPAIKNNMGTLLWCNARKNAVGFYEKVGFNCYSDEFEIDDIGPHYLMAIELK